MSFWSDLKSYIKENTYNRADYNVARRVISCYLKNDPYYPWDCLSVNMQEILIDYERESNYKGLTPPNAKEFSHGSHI